ncbi:MAG: 30S ribosomal protein S8 [Patescibacteria group bacterium]
MTDPISDMLTQIRNALSSRKAEVILPHSKFKQTLADVLKKHGLIEEVFIVNKLDRKSLGMKLRYLNGEPVIEGLDRVSKPGQRIYSKAGEIPKTQSGFGVTILSTSKGLLTDKEARKENLGGEVLCQIW